MDAQQEYFEHLERLEKRRKAFIRAVEMAGGTVEKSQQLVKNRAAERAINYSTAQKIRRKRELKRARELLKETNPPGSLREALSQAAKILALEKQAAIEKQKSERAERKHKGFVSPAIQKRRAKRVKARREKGSNW